MEYPHSSLKAKTDALVIALEARDTETGDHARRVANLAIQFAKTLKISINYSHLFIGSLLHDIGKISTPTSILCKPAKLNTEETAMMRLHALEGGTMLRKLDFPKDIVLMVEQHHEKFDGTGYPQGIAGDNISAGARIIGIVDAFDAMVSKRNYCTHKSYQMAFEEIDKFGGSQFDPNFSGQFKTCFALKNSA